MANKKLSESPDLLAGDIGSTTKIVALSGVVSQNVNIPIDEFVNDSLTSTNKYQALSANQGKTLDNKKIDKTSIENSLISTDSTKVLSANQGKSLKDSFDTLSTNLSSHTHNGTNAQKVDHVNLLNKGILTHEQLDTAFNINTGHKHDGSDSRKISHIDLLNIGTNTHNQIDNTLIDLQTQIQDIEGGILGGIAYNDPAPTPGKSGKYSFTSAGVCS